jgi:hypothetical protein
MFSRPLDVISFPLQQILAFRIQKTNGRLNTNNVAGENGREKSEEKTREKQMNKFQHSLDGCSVSLYRLLTRKKGKKIKERFHFALSRLFVS